MDPHIWPGKSRTTSSDIHSAAMWGYGMYSPEDLQEAMNDRERGSGIPVLATRLDDDDDNDFYFLETKMKDTPRRSLKMSFLWNTVSFSIIFQHISCILDFGLIYTLCISYFVLSHTLCIFGSGLTYTLCISYFVLRHTLCIFGSGLSYTLHILDFVLSYLGLSDTSRILDFVCSYTLCTLDFILNCRLCMLDFSLRTNFWRWNSQIIEISGFHLLRWGK